MDIPRPFTARRRRIRHTLYLLTAIVSIAAIGEETSRCHISAPRVARTLIQPDEHLTAGTTILELSNPAPIDPAAATLHVELRFGHKTRRHNRWAV